MLVSCFENLYVEQLIIFIFKYFSLCKIWGSHRCANTDTSIMGLTPCWLELVTKVSEELTVYIFRVQVAQENRIRDSLCLDYLDPEERGRKLLWTADNTLPIDMASWYKRLVSSFFSSIENIAFHLVLNFSLYNRISLKLYFEPSSRTSSLENLDIKSKGADLMLCVNMLVYRANMKLKQHSTESSKNCYRGYVISRNNEVNMPKRTERIFFIFYSVYAWCLPLVLVAVSMTFEFMPVIPSSYLKPNFGDSKCWFSSKWHDLVVINKSLWRRRSWSYKANYVWHVCTENFLSL